MFIITRYLDEEAKDSADSIGDLTNKIAFFVTKDTVITVHRVDIPWLKSMRDNWNQDYLGYDKEHLINRIIDLIIKGFLFFYNILML